MWNNFFSGYRLQKVLLIDHIHPRSRHRAPQTVLLLCMVTFRDAVERSPKLQPSSADGVGSVGMEIAQLSSRDPCDSMEADLWGVCAETGGCEWAWIMSHLFKDGLLQCMWTVRKLQCEPWLKNLHFFKGTRDTWMVHFISDLNFCSLAVWSCSG